MRKTIIQALSILLVLFMIFSAIMIAYNVISHSPKVEQQTQQPILKEIKNQKADLNDDKTYGLDITQLLSENPNVSDLKVQQRKNLEHGYIQDLAIDEKRKAITFKVHAPGITVIELWANKVGQEQILKAWKLEIIDQSFEQKETQWLIKAEVLAKKWVGKIYGLAYNQPNVGNAFVIEVTYAPKNVGDEDFIFETLNPQSKIGATTLQSIQTAIWHIQRNHEEYNISQNFFEQYKIKIKAHVYGDVDGPSAGIAFTTAILSRITNKPISSDIGMTGEITGLGIVGPVGGIKEKIMGAIKNGVKKLWFSVWNDGDINAVPLDLLRKVKITTRLVYDKIYADIFNNKYD
ncbi:S16 family serine protease [Williamsoniiplasma luminosum]|nr:S16 family serine protease [Williamsoniiplasma luminosum]